MKVRTEHELVALNTFLYYWNDGLSYVDVIDQLKNNTFEWGDIEVLGSFEYMPPEHLAELITELHDHLTQIYGVQT